MMAEGYNEQLDINDCLVGRNKWKCPDHNCLKLLSRKQTLITHMRSFHPELLKKIGTGVQHKTYKQYEVNPTKSIPKSTIYWRKRKECDVDIGESSSVGIEDYEIGDSTSASSTNSSNIMRISTDEPTRYGDSDMSFSSESEESIEFESSSDDEQYHQVNEATRCEPSHVRDPPLYVIAPQQDIYCSEITKSEHVMALGALATRHNLSNAAIGDLLDFIQLHLPTANTGMTSVRDLKEKCGFNKEYLKYNFYCEICKKLCSDKEEMCETAGCTGATNPDSRKYFVTSKINMQLAEVFERPGIWNLVQESHSLPESEILSDIKYGKDYKKLKQPGGFMFQSNNITMSLFTDGIPLFKSSSVSLWPVYLVINELPPKERFHRRNMILWGIWQGAGKPNMVMFLKPLVLDLLELYTQGFTFRHESEEICSKAMLIIATMDLQARAYVLNMTQHNGAFGCLYCLEEGETTPSGEGYCRAYPARDVPATLRTDQDVKASAFAAQRTGQRVDGFYGESVWLYLPYFSITTNVVIDYMHGTLLGVTKKFLELWFENKHSSRPWYIGDKTKQIDRNLHGIRPPYFIHRRPRAITKTYNHWKASELRNWLLFYSLPCLKNHLPELYLTHFSCLVEGIYILLGEGIAPEDLQRADKLLKTFVRNVSALYDPCIMSMNVHNMTHITSLVERWGPLWGWSCFPFESYNGEIKNTIHGTGNVCKDVFWHLQAQKRVARKVSDLPDGSRAKDFMQKMVNSGTLDSKLSCDNARQCHVIKGEEMKNDLDNYEKTSLQNEVGYSKKEDFLSSSKIVRNGFLMYSKHSRKVTKQNSFTILMNNTDVIEVSRYIVHKNSKQVFASGQLLSTSESVLPNRVPHIQKMIKREGAVVVRVECLREPVIIVEIENDIYGAVLPNHHEKD